MKRIFFSFLLGILMISLMANPGSNPSFQSDSVSAFTLGNVPEIEILSSNIDRNGDIWNFAFFGGENFVVDSEWVTPLLDDEFVSGLFAFILTSPDFFFDVVGLFFSEDTLGQFVTEEGIGSDKFGNLFPSCGLLVIYDLDLNEAVLKVDHLSATTAWQKVFMNSLSISDPTSSFYGTITIALFSAGFSILQAQNTFINSLSGFSGLFKLFQSILPWIQASTTRHGYIFGKFPIAESFIDYSSTSNESILMQFSSCVWFDEGRISGNDPIEINLAHLYHVAENFRLDASSEAVTSYILLLFPEHTVIGADTKIKAGNSVFIDLKSHVLTIYENGVQIDRQTGLQFTATVPLFSVQGSFPPNIAVKRILSNQFPVKGETVTITIIIENYSNFDITNVQIDDSENLQIYLNANTWDQIPCKIVEGQKRASFNRISGNSSQNLAYKVRFDEVGAYRMSDVTYSYFVDAPSYSDRYEEITHSVSTFVYVNVGLIGLVITYWPLIGILSIITGFVFIRDVRALFKDRRL